MYSCFTKLLVRQPWVDRHGDSEQSQTTFSVLDASEVLVILKTMS